MPRVSPAIARLAALPEGERALGAFKLVSQLGSGGHAPVWLAREVYGTTELRIVALKLFAMDSPDEGASERIVEEARALCRVEHPNVVRFYSMLDDRAKGIVALAMEYVRGTALHQRLDDLAKRKKSLPIDDVLSVGIAVASALSAVHQAGLVHRDVKPANVVESAGIYKLIDFGIAAAERRAAPEAPTQAAQKPSAKRQLVLDDLPLELSGTKASAMSTIVTKGGALDDDLAGITGTMGYVDPHCLATMARASPASDLY